MTIAIIAQELTVALVAGDLVIFVSGAVSTQAHDAHCITTVGLFVVVPLSAFEAKVAAPEKGCDGHTDVEMLVVQQ